MKLKLVAIASALLASGAAMAQTKAPEPDYTLTFNVSAVTDYRYRGISQSRRKPALQGGADFAHKSGFYVGTWASTIRWIEDVGGDSDVEIDLYGGYKRSFGAVAMDFGVLRYQYPNSSLGFAPHPNTTELYAAGTFGPATLKYSYAVTNLFGFADSKGSYYVDLNATFETGFWGLTVTPHVGYQSVKNNSFASYTDWSLALGKDFGNGFSASLAYVDTDSDAYFSPSTGKDLGKSTVVLGVKYSF
jgi:uncharacterized protein (TIGR02001 family)